MRRIGNFDLEQAYESGEVKNILAIQVEEEKDEHYGYHVINLIADIEECEESFHGKRIELYRPHCFHVDMELAIGMDDLFLAISECRGTVAGGITFDYETMEECSSYPSIVECLLERVFKDERDYDSYDTLICTVQEYLEICDWMKPGIYILAFTE